MLPLSICCCCCFEIHNRIIMTTLWQNIPAFCSFYRQLLSWYTLSQNSNVSAMDDSPALLPLWVRCDMSDPVGTAWFGAENLSLRDGNAPGVKFYSVTCRGNVTYLQDYLYLSHWVSCHLHVPPILRSTGSSVDKKSFPTLDELKQQHMDRHHPSSVSNKLFWIFSKFSLSIYTLLWLQVLIKGNARFSLFGAIVVENATVESQNCITVDLKWNSVESILETPPLSASTTLVGSNNT